jgi:hypothetical protein
MAHSDVGAAEALNFFMSNPVGFCGLNGMVAVAGGFPQKLKAGRKGRDGRGWVRTLLASRWSCLSRAMCV